MVNKNEPNSIDFGYNPQFFKPNRISESIYHLLDQLDVRPDVVDDLKSSFGSKAKQSASPVDPDPDPNPDTHGFVI